MVREYTHTLVVGDSSGDGHEKTENFLITSNFNEAQILDAYRLGVDIIKFDIMENNKDYQDRSICSEDVDKLKSVGFVFSNLDKWGVYYYIDPEIFVEIFIFIVSVGDPSFEYEYLPYNNIEIGGYGLFE